MDYCFEIGIVIHSATLEIAVHIPSVSDVKEYLLFVFVYINNFVNRILPQSQIRENP